MKQIFPQMLAFAALRFEASTDTAATAICKSVLPAPYIYYTGLAHSQQPNYVIPNLTFRAAAVNYYPGGDIGADMLRYFYISSGHVYLRCEELYQIQSLYLFHWHFR
ncbi:MAG: hypothetical protein ACYDC8_12765 [Gammaproteobacteria bacterium]